ncbi:glycosyltransferase family 2 protein [Saccharolobus islandicus]|uniref:glycosyltransferase family 2 protein n=1 Tax=Saccharolobus islandicus TaxID=43080 RepID=UPI003908134C
MITLQFLEDDDMFHEKRLEYIYHILRKNNYPKNVYIHNNAYPIDKYGRLINSKKILRKFSPPELDKFIETRANNLFGTFNTHIPNFFMNNLSSIIIDKEIILKRKELLEKIDTAIDSLFFINAVELKSLIYNIPERLTYIRLHDNNLSHITEKLNYKTKLMKLQKFIEKYEKAAELIYNEKYENEFASKLSLITFLYANFIKAITYNDTSIKMEDIIKYIKAKQELKIEKSLINILSLFLISKIPFSIRKYLLSFVTF